MGSTTTCWSGRTGATERCGSIAVPEALRGQQVVVVDDVLYQGHSLARVLEFLRAQHADPIRTAVLVDRRVTRLPLRADIAGLILQLAPDDVVECRVPPFEPVFEIDLFRPRRD